MNPEICIIAAMSENRVIGRDGKIPWRISADLKRFKELTTPHPIIMGRKTFESIGKPLPNRLNIIVSRNMEIYPEGCKLTPTLEDAIWAGSIFSETGRVFIIGGGEIYRQALELPIRDQINKLYLTLIEGNFEGDTFFPDYSGFKVVSEERGEENGVKFKFIELKS